MERETDFLLRQDRARIVAVCDLDSKRAEHAKAFVEGVYARKQQTREAAPVKIYGDYRELLRDGGIDAVSISTPDHWHCEPVIAAALAGKDIYVEKPLATTIAEGRAMIDASKLHDRIVQMGVQSRSAVGLGPRRC